MALGVLLCGKHQLWPKYLLYQLKSALFGVKDILQDSHKHFWSIVFTMSGIPADSKPNTGLASSLSNIFKLVSYQLALAGFV